MSGQEEDGQGVDGDFAAYGATVDAYGMPSNLMGIHHEDFFALLGRIVGLSSLLENHVLTVYQALLRAGQNDFTTIPVGELLKRSRKELPQLDGEPANRELLNRFLQRAEAAIGRRNQYVHSLWPAQAGERLFGWRPPRANEKQAALTVEASLPGMRRDLAELINLLNVQDWHRLFAVLMTAR